MNMKKLGQLLGLLALTLSLPALAEKPEHCPDVTAIRAVKYNQSNIEQDISTWRISSGIREFDTKRPWMFFIFGIKADNKTEAFDNAMIALQSLTYVSGPIKATDIFDTWVCNYKTQEGYIASAVALSS